jgi:hypothetical protein
VEISFFDSLEGRLEVSEGPHDTYRLAQAEAREVKAGMGYTAWRILPPVYGQNTPECIDSTKYYISVWHAANKKVEHVLEPYTNERVARLAAERVMTTCERQDQRVIQAQIWQSYDQGGEQFTLVQAIDRDRDLIPLEYLD